MGKYQTLVAWQRAMDLVDAVYLAVSTFPKSEVFALTQQMKSAAVSVPSNIAEGCGRGTYKQERRFCRDARGSLYELQTQIDIATRQQFLSADAAAQLKQLAARVGMLNNPYLQSVEKEIRTPDA